MFCSNNKKYNKNNCNIKVIQCGLEHDNPLWITLSLFPILLLFIVGRNDWPPNENCTALFNVKCPSPRLLLPPLADCSLPGNAIGRQLRNGLLAGGEIGTSACCVKSQVSIVIGLNCRREDRRGGRHRINEWGSSITINTTTTNIPHFIIKERVWVAVEVKSINARSSFCNSTPFFLPYFRPPFHPSVSLSMGFISSALGDL